MEEFFREENTNIQKKRMEDLVFKDKKKKHRKLNDVKNEAKGN